MEEKRFEARVREMEGKMYRTAYAILWNNADVADAIQESIFRAWRKLPALRDENSFDAWLMRILVNECKSQHRKRSRMGESSYDDAIAQTGEPSQREQTDTGLSDALQRTPEKYRVIVLLHHMEAIRWQRLRTCCACRCPP